MQGSGHISEKPVEKGGTSRACKTKLERVRRDSTEHKKAEDVLRRSHKEWEDTFNAISDWVAVTDLKARILRTNRIGEDFTGIPLPEIVGQSCCKLIHGSDKHIAGCPLQKMLHTRQCESAELKVPATNRWLMVTIDPVTDEAGNLVGAVHITRDITERKKAEEELKQLEEFRKSIIENANIWLDVLDEKGNVKIWNKAAEEISGYTSDEVVGHRKIWEWQYPDPEYREKIFKKAEKIIQGETVEDFETEITTKSGEKRIISWYSRNLISEHGNSIGSVALGRDITKHKQVENELRKFKTISDKAGYGVSIVDLEGNVIYNNTAYDRMHGYTPGELISKHLSIFHTEQQMANVNRLIEQLNREGNYVAEEVWHKRNDNSEFPTLMTGTLIKDANGTPLFMAGTSIDITDRKKAEEALRQSEKKYKDLFENAQEAIVTVDLEGRITDVNKLVEEYGFNRQELIGKKLFDFVPEYDRARSVRDFEILVGGNPVKGEMDVITPKGIAIVEYRDNPIVRSGEVIGVQILLADITDRRRAEEALRREHNLLRLLIDNLPYTIYAKDCKSRFILGNDAVVKYEGFQCEKELLGKTDFDLYPEELAASFYDREQQVIQKDQPMINEEGLYLDKQGNEQWVLVTKVPLRDENGKIVGLVGINRDITERKRAEEALAQERNLLRALMDNIPDYIYFKDRQSRFIRTTKAHAKMFGLSDPAEAIGKTDFDFFSENHAHQAYEDEQEIIRTGQPLLNIEERETWPDRPDTWALTSKMPLRDEEGKIIGTFGISRDITERKKAEKKLLDYQRQLKSLASQLTLAEERERRRIATELHDQIGQALAISKVKLDGLRHDVYSEKPDKILDEVCSLLGQAIADTRSLTFDLSSPILHELGFEAAVAAWLTEEIEQKYGIVTELVVDKKQKPLDDDIKGVLFRDVRELLINVVKHSKATKLKVSILRVRDQISISVEDNGVGFVPDEVTAKAVGNGGFGLFSIRQRLEELGGRLEIESEPSHGCRVVMMAPLKQG
jgi:PAS domain S-box-containing protein